MKRNLGSEETLFRPVGVCLGVGGEPRAFEGASKLIPRSIASPKGTNSIAGGTAPGRDRIDDQPCKGLHLMGLCNPCRVGRMVVGIRGRCPRLLNLSPSGKKISEIDF